MAFYLRAPNGRGIGGVKVSEGEIGRGYWPNGKFRFVSSAPLAMHDDCAREHLGEVSAPWDAGREAFSELAGQPLCWSPGPYSHNDHPCYWCGDAC